MNWVNIVSEDFEGFLTILLFRWVSDLVTTFDVGPDRTHVGVVVYSDDPVLAIALDAHTNKEDLLHAVANIKYKKGSW